MATVNKPNTFTSGTNALASEVNDNFDTIYNEFNGSISSANLADDAVTTDKITDANVTTAKLADDAVTAAKVNFGGSGAGVWWEEIARTTLGSAGDTITVSSIPARKYLKILFHILNSGQLNASMTFNQDTGTNYATRVIDGASGASTTSQTSIPFDPSTPSTSEWVVLEFVNLAAAPKLGVGQYIDAGGADAGTAPSLRVATYKWHDTSNQISRIDVSNAGTGDFDTGSEVVVLGHD